MGFPSNLSPRDLLLCHLPMAQPLSLGVAGRSQGGRNGDQHHCSDGVRMARLGR